MVKGGGASSKKKASPKQKSPMLDAKGRFRSQKSTRFDSHGGSDMSEEEEDRSDRRPRDSDEEEGQEPEAHNGQREDGRKEEERALSNDTLANHIRNLALKSGDDDVTSEISKGDKGEDARFGNDEPRHPVLAGDPRRSSEGSGRNTARREAKEAKRAAEAKQFKELKRNLDKPVRDDNWNRLPKAHELSLGTHQFPRDGSHMINRIDVRLSGRTKPGFQDISKIDEAQDREDYSWDDLKEGKRLQGEMWTMLNEQLRSEDELRFKAGYVEVGKYWSRGKGDWLSRGHGDLVRSNIKAHLGQAENTNPMVDGPNEERMRLADAIKMAHVRAQDDPQSNKKREFARLMSVALVLLREAIKDGKTLDFDV